MGRRGRAGREPGRDRAAAVEPAERWAPVPGLLARPDEAPLSTAEWAFRLVLVVARNAVGLVGLLFFGWSAASLTVLYFADTLAGMWACFAAVGFKVSNADPRRGFWTLVEGVLSGVAVAMAVVAIVAVPLGMPLVLLLGPSQAWKEAQADRTLAWAIGLIALSGLVSAIRARPRPRRGAGRGGDRQAGVRDPDDSVVSRPGGDLQPRHPAGRLGLVIVVLAYAAASVWSELQPERFANLIPDRRPPAAR